MAFDRSKYKATSVAAAKQADQEVAAITGSKEKGLNADYLNIKEGDGNHKYRIYPPHVSDEGVLYAVPKGVHWLPCEVPSKDKNGNFIKDKNDKNVTEIKNRPLFNAKIHGGKKKDLVEEYIAFADKISRETYNDEKDRKTFMEPINGGFDSKYDGILLRQTWVMYVDELMNGKKMFGRLEIGRAVKERLNKIAATESASEPLGTDPFTDPEEGRAINIIYDKNAKKAQDYYSTEIYAPLVPGGKGQIQLFPLSDSDLEKFETYPSLKKMFINVYDRKTFDTTLKGLKVFDDEHELGIFGYDAWLDVIEELSNEYPEGEDSSQEQGKEEKGDEFDRMDRDELKDYNRENKLGIIVNKTITDDAFRDQIRAAVANKEPQGEVKQATKVIETPGDLPWEKQEGLKATKQPVVEKQVSQSVKDRLANLKNKTA